MKRMILGMLLITALGLGWQYFLVYQYKHHPEWKKPGEQENSTVSESTPAAGPTTAPAYAAGAPTTQSSTQPALSVGSGTGATLPSGVPSIQQAPVKTGWHAIEAVPGPDVKVGSSTFQDARYHVGLSVAAAGAGLNEVVLNQFRQEVDSPELFNYQHPYDQDREKTRPLATTAVSIDGTKVDLWATRWRLADLTDRSARYEIELSNGAGAVRVVKEYVVGPAETDPNTPQGYEVQVNYSLQNLAPQPHNVSFEFNGPTVQKAETARQDTEVVAGYDDDGLLHLEHQGAGEFKKAGDAKDFVPNDKKFPLIWLGESSSYFNAIVRPQEAKKLARAVVSVLNPEAPSEDHVDTIQFSTSDFALGAAGSPQASANYPLRVFFGPKSRQVLNARYYSAFPNAYDQTLVMVGGMCGFCTFPWLISILVVMLGWFHTLLFHDWGLAIIALVCLVRLGLHPITKRSQVSMMKMQKLAPEIERLKKKYGDDKDAFAKAQMELYKSVGFTPILGCLPMFLQMPIFIALWRALQTTFELRQAPFLEFFGRHFTWIHDLAQPDFLIKFGSPIALPFGWHMAGVNVLPIAMAIVTFVNQKYFVPKPAAMSPEQEQQQKMMTWMTLIFPFMFYTFPSGLNLYYLTSTSLGIIESKRIRAHIKEREEAEKAQGPVIVDAGKSSRRRRDDPPGGAGAGKSAAPVKPAGGMSGFLANLQARAQQIAREAEQKRKKKA